MWVGFRGGFEWACVCLRKIKPFPAVDRREHVGLFGSFGGLGWGLGLLMCGAVGRTNDLSCSVWCLDIEFLVFGMDGERVCWSCSLPINCL